MKEFPPSSPTEPKNLDEKNEQERKNFEKKLKNIEERFLELLKEQDIIEYGPKNEMIIDLETLKKLVIHHSKKGASIESSLNALKKKDDENFLGKSNLLTLYFHTFKNDKVVSRKDWQNGQREGKPLFYNPENEKIGSIKDIKTADFYLKYDDVVSFQSQSINEFNYPGTNHKYDEVILPLIVYHPNYGNGFRDNGILYVIDRQKNVSTRFNKEFAKHFMSAPRPEQDSITTRTAIYVNENYPWMYKTGLFQPNDFPLPAGSEGDKLFGQEKTVPKTGMIFIDRVGYYLGKNQEIQDSKNKVYKISANLAGITRTDPAGNENLIYTFSLYQPNDKRLKRASTNKEGGKTYYRTDETLTNLTKFDKEKFYKQRQGETGEQFKKRIKELESFEALAKLKKRSSIDMGINLNNLKFNEQILIATVANKLMENYEEFRNFAIQFGLSGLRTFVSIEYGMENGRKVIDLAKNLKQDQAARIFNKYNEIINTAEKINDYLTENFGQDKNFSQETINQITENLLKKGKDLLVNFAEKVEKAKEQNQQIGEEEIIKELDNTKADILLFASSFRALQEKDELIKLEDFQKTKIETLNSQNLKETDKKKMEQIVATNWAQFPQLHKKIMEGFAEALATKGKKFQILKYNEDILGFIRFDQLEPNVEYAGSLNINPQARGSKIGEAILKNILAKEAQNNTILATAYPKLPIAPRYIGEFGFVATGIIENYENTGEDFLQMERDDAKNSQYKLANLPLKELENKFISNQYDLRQPEIILKYDFQTQYQKALMEADKILKTGQFVMTGFQKDKQNNIFLAFEKKIQAEEMRQAA